MSFFESDVNIKFKGGKENYIDFDQNKKPDLGEISSVQLSKA